MYQFVSSHGLAAIAATAVLLLSGCSSQLTGIDAPASVAPGETFEVTITHAIDDSAPFPGLGGLSESALVFGVALPVGWSISSPARYVSEWDGVPIDLAVNVVPGGPPETDWVDVFVEESLSDPPPTDEELALLRTLDCKSFFDVDDVLPPGYRWVFLQTDSPLPNAAAVSGDTGELQLEITAGGVGGEQAVLVIHGVYGVGTEDVGDPPAATEVTLCAWIPDFDQEEPGEVPFIVPSNVFAEVFQDGSQEAVSVPVPVNNKAVLAVLVLLLGGFGLVMARRRSQA